MIHRTRKLQLLKILQQTLFFELPKGIRGNKGLATECLNRIESISKDVDEYKFMVEAVATLLQQGKKEVIVHGAKGRAYSKKELDEMFKLSVKPRKEDLGMA